MSAGENPADCARLTTIMPRASLPRSIGTATNERMPLSAAWRRNSELHDGSVSTSTTWCTRFVSTECSGGEVGWWGGWNRSLAASALPAKPPRAATRLTSSPSYRPTATAHAPKSRKALSAMASKTGCTSLWARLMARRMSAVAVCRSRDSVRSRLRASSSLNSRTFSIAMTA